VGAWFLRLVGQKSQIAPLPSHQLLHCNKHFNYWLNKNNQCLKSLLLLININTSNLLSVKQHVSGLNIRPAMLKIRLLVISILLTISSNCGLRLQASIALCSFNLKGNQQWCQYSCVSLYWTKSQWSTKPHWFRWVFLPVSSRSWLTC